MMLSAEAAVCIIWLVCFVITLVFMFISERTSCIKRPNKQKPKQIKPQVEVKEDN